MARNAKPKDGYFFKIEESISGMLKTLNLENRYLQTLAITHWENLLGPTVVSRTEKIFFKENTMCVVVKSAPLKHQLNMSKDKIIKAINKEVGKNVVEDMIVY